MERLKEGGRERESGAHFWRLLDCLIVDEWLNGGDQRRRTSACRTAQEDRTVDRRNDYYYYFFFVDKVMSFSLPERGEKK